MVEALRVLHVAPGSPFGGVQRLAIDIAAAQRSRRADALLVWTGDAERAVEAAERAGVPSYAASGAVPARVTQTAFHLRRLRPDIVHLHMASPWVGALLPHRSSLVVMHLHGRPGAASTLQGRVSAVLERAVLAKADVFIAISAWIEAAWRGTHPSGSFATVRNGITMPPAQPELRGRPHGGAPVIGMGSRLAPDKGTHEFVDFALELHCRLPQVRFFVAGDGPERAALEERAAPLVRSGIFAFLGFVGDMPAFWSSLDLAVFSAPNEPFGLRLIEPLAQGVPVVAYRTGAGSDEIINLCRGIESVSYGDTAALAELAADLLSDETRRTWMAEAGFEDLHAHFTIERMAEGVDAAYAQAWGRRRNVSA